MIETAPWSVAARTTKGNDVLAVREGYRGFTEESGAHWGSRAGVRGSTLLRVAKFGVGCARPALDSILDRPSI